MNDAVIVRKADSYAAVRGLEHLEYERLGGNATKQNNPILDRKKRVTYLDCANKLGKK
ncbi:hypothetical protein M6G53_20445 [Serratia nevei]|uniref:hypothetical protein n=1 Tax=Serratia nevei TaxID=2703794 RepID=UPI0020A06BC6|nr:hypothetical protein [Serratia nevei]MCP1107744.1 hypothetical protein [Serratia nevei]